MKLYLVAMGWLTTAIAFAPLSGLTQQETKTNAPATQKKATPKAETKNARGRPATGKVAAIDTLNKTVTVGETVLQVTSETRIRKHGKPATLDDGVVGEAIGYFVQEHEGKQLAVSIRFGPPVSRTPPVPKKETPPAEGEKKPDTNAPSTTSQATPFDTDATARAAYLAAYHESYQSRLAGAQRAIACSFGQGETIAAAREQGAFDGTIAGEKAVADHQIQLAQKQKAALR